MTRSNKTVPATASQAKAARSIGAAFARADNAMLAFERSVPDMLAKAGVSGEVTDQVWKARLRDQIVAGYKEAHIDGRDIVASRLAELKVLLVALSLRVKVTGETNKARIKSARAGVAKKATAPRRGGGAKSGPTAKGSRKLGATVPGSKASRVTVHPTTTVEGALIVLFPHDAGVRADLAALITDNGARLRGIVGAIKKQARELEAETMAREEQAKAKADAKRDSTKA